MYSDRGKAAVTRVVETVVALPCRVMGAVASVMSGEVLLPRWSGVRRPMIIISMFLRVFCCSDLGIPYYGTQHY